MTTSNEGRSPARTGLRALALTAMLAAALAAGPGAARAKPEPETTDSYSSGWAKDHEADPALHWTWTLAAGKTIEIKGVNGSIRARKATGGKAELQAWKHARRSDPAEVKIEVIEHENGVTVCAVYPAPPGERPNECGPGEEGHMHTRDNDVQVDFELQVPDGVGFIGRTVNGAVEARSLTAPVEAHTVNGRIIVSTTGRAAASTVNGSIDVRMGSAPWTDPLEFTTVNGGITVELPEPVNADVRCSTVNGAIESELPLMLRGKFSRRRLEGTIGKGGPDLRLETVNGSIRLLRASI